MSTNTQVRARHHSKLLTNIEDHVDEEGFALLDVWMSHGDRVDELPEGFVCIASTDNAPLLCPWRMGIEAERGERGGG